MNIGFFYENQLKHLKIMSELNKVYRQYRYIENPHTCV